jgi:tetratricopeptide (TPR) repeat protein
MPSFSISILMAPPTLTRPLAILAFACLTTLASACGKDDSGARVPLDQVGSQSGSQSAAGGTLSPEVRAALDRGNEAYRAKRYDEALTAYRDAAAAAPGDAAPYYGIQMAARALGRSALADSAAEKIRVLSPGSSTGGATDPHALPPDHPKIKVTEDVPKKSRS